MKPTPHGMQATLVLRTDLIGFHRVPMRHTGEHLAQVLVYVLDRIAILPKVSILPVRLITQC